MRLYIEFLILQFMLSTIKAMSTILKMHLLKSCDRRVSKGNKESVKDQNQ